MVDENGSTRGIACVTAIICPVRMCQPMPPSPNSFVESGVQSSVASIARKIKSPTKGSNTRIQPERNSTLELLATSIIALNLIGQNHEQQENRKKSTTRGHRRRRIRRLGRRSGAGPRACRRHVDRPQELPHISAAALSSGDRWTFSGRDCGSHSFDSPASKKY